MKWGCLNLELKFGWGRRIIPDENKFIKGIDDGENAHADESGRLSILDNAEVGYRSNFLLTWWQEGCGLLFK